MPKIKLEDQNSGDSFRGNRKSQGISAVGRRKEATAVVRLVEDLGGKNRITVNGLGLAEYFFERPLSLKKMTRPLEVTGVGDRYSALVKVVGGGKSAQVDAITLGIARALVSFDTNLKPLLRREGLLTRDPRQKERKKPGFLRARKKPQYSKR